MSTPVPAAATELLLGAEEAARAMASSARAPRLTLDARQASDVHCIAVGAFSPLRGFMGAEDHAAVCDRMRLGDGTLWPLPVVLAVDTADARARRPGETVLLEAPDRSPLALLAVDGVFDVDVPAEVERCFGTADPAHPGVAARLAQGPHCVAGAIRALRVPASDFPEQALTPEQTRARFAALGWRSVVGFQTRNPVHRAHEYLHKVALETVDGLFLQPLVGETKDDDISANVRMRCYMTLVDLYYPRGRVVLGTYPAAMRYAGPREAVLHALVRRNYGCTHFIVGRDHAGVGAYYGSFDAQRLALSLDPAELGVVILPFDHTFYCRACGQMASPRTCPHDTEHHLVLSGTAVRRMLAAGELPPPEFSRPEVARILAEAAAR